jgi:hypothetical protein
MSFWNANLRRLMDEALVPGAAAAITSRVWAGRDLGVKLRCHFGVDLDIAVILAPSPTSQLIRADRKHGLSGGRPITAMGLRP